MRWCADDRLLTTDRSQRWWLAKVWCVRARVDAVQWPFNVLHNIIRTGNWCDWLSDWTELAPNVSTDPNKRILSINFRAIVWRGRYVNKRLQNKSSKYRLVSKKTPIRWALAVLNFEEDGERIGAPTDWWLSCRLIFIKLHCPPTRCNYFWSKVRQSAIIPAKSDKSDKLKVFEGQFNAINMHA